MISTLFEILLPTYNKLIIIFVDATNFITIVIKTNAHKASGIVNIRISNDEFINLWSALATYVTQIWKVEKL